MASANYLIRVLPQLHQLECELVLERDSAGPLELTTPTWVPGAYAPMKYGRDLFNLQVESTAGEPLAWKREGWQGIALESAPRSVRLRWTALASDAAWGELCGVVDHEYAIVRATRLFFPLAHEGAYRVRYVVPEGWPIHHPAGTLKLAADTFEYASFLELLETPVVCGKFERITRELHGVAFHHVFVDRTVGFDSEAKAFVDSAMRVAECAHQVFGGFPFKDYTYVFSHAPNAHWGLEHPDSTMIALGENVYVDKAARYSGARVCAHELFHAWNVCRMKPEALVLPDFRVPPTPDTLWIAEGTTRYYEFLLSVRANEATPEQLFSNVVNYHRHLSAMPAAARVSALDSSRATFLNHNKYPGSINASIDFYDIGMLISFELDAKLRLSGATLDEKLAKLYSRAMERGGGYSSAEAYATLASGEEMSRWLKARVESPARASEVPALLEKLGFAIETKPVRYLGLVLAKDNAGPELAQVLDDAPAAASGIAAGDVIQRIEGFPYSLKALKWVIEHRDEVRLAVLRGHRTLEFALRVGEREDISALRWNGDDAALERIRSWLGRKEIAWKRAEAIPLTAYDNFHGVQTVI